MENNETKKALYKQKPTADLHEKRSDYITYTCQIDVNDTKEVLFFDVPVRECEFEEVVPAQLLIRWLV